MVAKKKGTIAGAVALVIGTSIGSGILALPEKASPAVLSYLSLLLFVSFVFWKVCEGKLRLKNGRKALLPLMSAFLS